MPLILDHSFDLSIASCNVQNLYEGSSIQKLFHFIIALDDPLNLPDIIALQEIGAKTKSDHPRAEAIIGDWICQQIAQRSGIQYRYLDLPPTNESSGGAADLNIRPAFLVKESLSVQQLQTLPTMSCFSGDEQQFFSASRYPLALTVDYHGHPLMLINCHLKSQNAKTNQDKKRARKQRNQQAQAIYNFYTQQLPNHYIILLGDFNDTPNSQTLEILQSKELKSIWKDLPGRLYTTKHRNRPVILDYILVDHRLSYHNPQAHHINTNLDYTFRYSDHDPISVQISAIPPLKPLEKASSICHNIPSK